MAEDTKVILIYGKPGCGKTKGIASLARTHQFGDVHIVNMDMDGIASAKDAQKNLLPGITATNIRDTTTLDREWKRLAARRDVPAECQTLAFDSFSLIDLRVIMSLSGQTSPGEVGQMNQRKWGDRMMIMNAFIIKAHDMPFKYVIFTAHERVEKNDSGQSTKISPSVGSDKTKDVGEGALSAIIHMKVAPNKKRILTLNDDPVILAKCRGEAIQTIQNANGTTDKPLAEVLSLL